MTVQISRRGKAFLETAQTLLRAAQAMTDQAIAGQLKALADDYQLNSEHVCGMNVQFCLSFVLGSRIGEIGICTLKGTIGAAT